MKNENFNELFGYLMANDMLNNRLGLKKIAKCPDCNRELYIYDDYHLYCKNCMYLYESDINNEIDNKVLSYSEKRRINKNE